MNVLPANVVLSEPAIASPPEENADCASATKSALPPAPNVSSANAPVTPNS